MCSTVFNLKSFFFFLAKSYFPALQLWCDHVQGLLDVPERHSLSLKNKFASFLVLNNLFFYCFVRQFTFCGWDITGGYRHGHKITSALSSVIFSISHKHLVPKLFQKQSCCLQVTEDHTKIHVYIYKKLKTCKLKFSCCNQLGETPPPSFFFFLSFFNLVPVWFIIKLQLAPSYWKHRSVVAHRRKQKAAFTTYYYLKCILVSFIFNDLFQIYLSCSSW